MKKTMTEDEFKNEGRELLTKLELNAKTLATEAAISTRCLGLINEAKAFLEQDKIADALAKYTAAAKELSESISVRSEPMAWRLLGIELVYLLVLLVIGYFTYTGSWKNIVNQSLQTAWFGALGGITIAIYGIYTHVQKKDFDPKFQLWYLCKPIIGAIFGWFVYVIYLIIIASTSGIPKTGETSDSLIKFPQLPFAISFLAGFSERFTTKMIDKLMSVLITWESDKTESKP
jgi:hypothetical protein